MISDEEIMSESDSDGEEPPSPDAPQAEKRQYHNLLERNRRNVLKYSFWNLRCAVPSLAKKKLVMNDKRASRAKILKRAIEYISRDEQKRPCRNQDIRDLKRENALLEEHLQSLQRAQDTGDMSNVEAILENFDEIKQKNYEIEKPDTEEDDDEDTDDAEDAELMDDAVNDPDNEVIDPEEPGEDWSPDSDNENSDIDTEDPREDWSPNYDNENSDPEQDAVEDSESFASEESSSDHE